MRVITHRRVFTTSTTVGRAAAFIKGIVAAATYKVVRPRPGFLQHLVAADHLVSAYFKPMSDAQIAMLCQEHAISTTLTNNRDLKRFEALRVRRLD